MNELRNTFGNIDIYLFDQLLKGTFDGCTDILDVGCGNGRNIVYFLRNGFNVSAIDQDPQSIEHVSGLNNFLSPTNPSDNFKVGLAENLPFEDKSFDLAICSAVLHFAKSPAHFDSMLWSIWRTLRRKGFLFVRLASSMGIEHLVKPIGSGRFQLPDGSERFLVSEEMLLNYTKKLNGILFEPIKTTNVQNLRCMTTWCLQKKSL
jgi:SAM-dependent methyltransferase